MKTPSLLLRCLLIASCAHAPEMKPAAELGFSEIQPTAPETLPPSYTVHPDELFAYTYRALEIAVSPWPRQKPAAVSLTFDDGTLDQYLIGYPELEARNLKATFFLISDFVEEGVWQDSGDIRRLFSWEHARTLAREGHEIGSHGKTHRELLGQELFVEQELRESRETIQQEIPGQLCVSLSWPFWRWDEKSRTVAERYYIAGRAGGGLAERYTEKGVPSSNGENLHWINALGLLSSNSTDDWKRIEETVYADGGWLVLNFHGIDDGYIQRDFLGWQPLDLPVFRGILDYAKEQDVWIAPFGRIVRYIREREALNVVLTELSSHRIGLTAGDSLDNGIFDQPLTLRVRLPQDWNGAEVWQEGRPVWHMMTAEGVLFFDVRPDRGTAWIVRKSRQ